MNAPEKLPNLAINHDGFVFDPSTGDSYVMNPTGLAILQGLQDGIDETQRKPQTTKRQWQQSEKLGETGIR